VASRDKVYRLINKLTKAEKRFFRSSFSIAKTKNNYLRLFDLIEGKNFLNDESIPLKNRKKNFSDTKYLLYQRILKSLRFQYSGRSLQSKVFSKLQETELLFEREMYSQAMDSLGEVTELVEAHDFHFLIPVLIFWEQTILRFSGGAQIPGSAYELKNLTNKTFELSTLLTLLRDARELSHLRGQRNVDEEVLRLADRLSHPRLREVPGTFFKQHLYHEAHLMQAMAREDFDAFSFHHQKIFEVWEREEGKSELLHPAYQWMVRVSLRFQCSLSMPDLPERQLRRLHGESGSGEVSLKILEFAWHLMGNRMAALLDLESQLLIQVDEALAPEWRIWWKCLRLAFRMRREDYRMALEGVRELEKEAPWGIDSRERIWLRLLYLVLYLELEEDELFESVYLSSQRWLRRLGNDFELERVGLRNLGVRFRKGASLRALVTFWEGHLPHTPIPCTMILSDALLKWAGRKK